MKKIFSKSLALLLVFSSILSIQVRADNGEDSAISTFVETSATGYLLMDGFTLDTIAGKNADQPLPMASTTKIMTCIVALEEGTLSDVVTIPKEAVGVEGSSVYLSLGERLTLEELLFALMLESANDAAVAIALHISHSIDDFALLMNQKARDLGMKGTNYINPHGLPADGHYSTARDLCKLLAYGMQNEAFRVFSGTKKITISAPDSGKRFLANHNKLLRIYDACVAGKTGFTKEAGRCLVTAAEKNGRILICATLGDPNDWLDHMSLFQYGFSLMEEKRILSSDQISLSIPVVGGQSGQIRIGNTEEFSIWLRSSEKIDYYVEAPDFVYAGIAQGDVLGSVVYYLNGRELKRIDLVAQNDALKSKERLSFWERLIQNFRLWID